MNIQKMTNEKIGEELKRLTEQLDLLIVKRIECEKEISDLKRKISDLEGE